ncbi:4'-phosphopantetheinyl transferase family protein [Streptacidiphilus cavernicola]|uniref:4'-phosphopantetheinyl transferase superfamily protein n=1 Tax=Streptacidiphilus cavernicola TaxID=3342716 RepID=A0ABV6VWI7_9ACTN
MGGAIAQEEQEEETVPSPDQPDQPEHPDGLDRSAPAAPSALAAPPAPPALAAPPAPPVRAAADRAGSPPVGGAGLWLLRVPEVAVGALAVGELDQDERARTDAFVRDSDRVRYAAAHIALRRLLGSATGMPARELVMVREPCPCCGALHGRPALAVRPGAEQPGRLPHFSLSHGGDLILIGLADVPIGVDVEALPEPRTVTELAAVLHPGEQRELSGVPAELRTAAFARLWTRKEAYLKGIGTGLGRDPAADYLGSGGLAPTPPGWTVADLDLARDEAEGHAAAYALRHDSAAAPRLRRLPVDAVLG